MSNETVSDERLAQLADTLDGAPPRVYLVGSHRSITQKTLLDAAAALRELQQARVRIGELENDSFYLYCKKNDVERELAALKRDGERYRWLRSQPMLNGQQLVSLEIMDINEDGPTGVFYSYDGHELDAAIDAATRGREDDTMTEDNQRRASPELEAAANAAVHSPPSDRAVAEFAVHPGVIGVLAREVQRLRATRGGDT